MATIELPSVEMGEVEALEQLRAHAAENCVPSATSVENLQQADVVLVSGQFVGAGKDTFIRLLEGDGRINVPSYTNRDLRPGEIEGVHKHKRSLPIMATMAVDGAFLELEEMREGIFYATPGESNPGQPYVKDLDLKGALRLRSFAPNIPIIVPLPPLYEAIGKQVTEWERRVVKRDGFSQALPDKSVDDMRGRLAGVIEEADRIFETGLADDERTLFIVSADFPTVLHAMRTFLETGIAPQEPGTYAHLHTMRTIAATALKAG